MGTQDGGFMSRRSWPVVPNHGIFAQTGAERHDLSTYQYADTSDQNWIKPCYLLSQFLKMLPDQMVAPGVEQYWKAPRIAESNQVGLSWVEIDIHDPRVCGAVSRQLRPVEPRPLLRIKDYADC